MDFGLSEEQEMLQQSAREFLTQECPPTFVRALYTEPDGFSRELHRKMAEQGWTGLLIPEAHGGLGLSMLDMAVLFEEMGRAVVPGPFIFSSCSRCLGVHAGGSPAQKKTWLASSCFWRSNRHLCFSEGRRSYRRRRRSPSKRRRRATAISVWHKDVRAFCRRWRTLC